MMTDANIIGFDGKVLMGIRDIKKVLQNYEYHHTYTCKESRGKGCKCKKAKVFDIKCTTVD